VSPIHVTYAGCVCAQHHQSFLSLFPCTIQPSHALCLSYTHTYIHTHIIQLLPVSAFRGEGEGNEPLLTHDPTIYTLTHIHTYTHTLSSQHFAVKGKAMSLLSLTIQPFTRSYTHTIPSYYLYRHFAAKGRETSPCSRTISCVSGVSLSACLETIFLSQI
jgi:hypothetical protein